MIDICRMKIFPLLLLISIWLSGCSTVTVDQLRWEETSIDPSKDSVVVLGRHHSSEYETEPSLVSCVGGKLRKNIRGLNIIDANEFKDQFYPWFEPRTAPLNMEKFISILNEPLLAEHLNEKNIRYMVWITGATEQTSKAGSVSCGATIGAAGCFGFASWVNESEYEASIWDFQDRKDVGRISTDASGTSYVPAVIVPLPFLARVQANACDGMGDQISQFLQPIEGE